VTDGIILSIAYSLLHPKPSGMHYSKEDSGAQQSPAVYPLAMPLLAGPGVIATVIGFAHGAHGMPVYAD